MVLQTCLTPQQGGCRVWSAERKDGIKMKKWWWKLAPLALGALVFWGCSSIPAKAASDESLVVIKTEFINPENLARGYEVFFNYSGDYPSTWVGQYSWDFNVVVIREPGVKLLSYGARIQANMRGDSKDYEADLPMPYEPGRIVVADYVFSHRIEKTAEHKYMSYIGFRKITAQEKDDMVQALKADGRFASWMKEGE
jgi:hypothetical protein